MKRKADILRLLSENKTYAQIERELGCSRSVIAYHAAKMGRPVDQKARLRYDWPAIQAYVNAGHSRRECQAAFGFSIESWSKAVKAGRLVPRNASGFREVLSADQITERGRSPHNLKRRLLRDGVLRNECYLCGISVWLEKPLVLHLDHVNGDGDDHRLENLRLLCPNCHSQTDTYSGRNVRLRKIASA